MVVKAKIILVCRFIFTFDSFRLKSESIQKNYYVNVSIHSLFVASLNLYKNKVIWNIWLNEKNLQLFSSFEKRLRTITK